MLNAHTVDYDLDSILSHSVRPHCVLSENVETALKSFDRTLFLPPAMAPFAYADNTIELKRRCELPFLVIAQILQALNLKSHEKAVVFSSGAGYTASLLSRLVSSVTAFESDSILFARLMDATRGNLKLTPVSVFGDEKFDVIFLDGGSFDCVPQNIIEKLLPGGRIAYLNAISESNSLNNQPLCNATILFKHPETFDLESHVVCQSYFPRLVMSCNSQNEPFHF